MTAHRARKSPAFHLGGIYQSGGAIRTLPEQFVSLTDPGSATSYELTGPNGNVYPSWVDSVSNPAWANITYGDPQPLSYKEEFTLKVRIVDLVKGL